MEIKSMSAINIVYSIGEKHRDFNKGDIINYRGQTYRLYAIASTKEQLIFKFELTDTITKIFEVITFSDGKQNLELEYWYQEQERIS